MIPARSQEARYALFHKVGRHSAAELLKDQTDGSVVRQRSANKAVTMYVFNEALFAKLILAPALQRLVASAA